MVSPLDRKLLRDLWRMKLQSAAIELVIAVGVLLLLVQPDRLRLQSFESLNLRVEGGGDRRGERRDLLMAEAQAG